MITAGQIGAPDRPLKEHIAREQNRGLARGVDHMPRAVAGRKHHIEGEAGKLHHIAAAHAVLGVKGPERTELRKHPAALLHHLIEGAQDLVLELGHPHLGTRRLRQLGDGAHVIKVRVREEDAASVAPSSSIAPSRRSASAPGSTRMASVDSSLARTR